MKTFPIPCRDQIPIYEFGTVITKTNMAAMNSSSCSYLAAVIVQCMNVQLLEDMLQAVIGWQSGR
jgi:hypothetical protein